jgi:hypothetical protein
MGLHRAHRAGGDPGGNRRRRRPNGAPSRHEGWGNKQLDGSDERNGKLLRYRASQADWIATWPDLTHESELA